MKEKVLWSLAAVVMVLMLLGGVALGVFSRVLRAAHGEHTGTGSPLGWSQSFQDIRQIAIAPKEGFPGQHRLTLLVTGIDDNWSYIAM